MKKVVLDCNVYDELYDFHEKLSKIKYLISLNKIEILMTESLSRELKKSPQQERTLWVRS